MNASIAAQLMLRAGLRSGVWAPEEFFDVEELRKRHFAIVVEETELWRGQFAPRSCLI